MNKKERFQKIRRAFSKLVKEGKEGAFVIFTNPEIEKFVQFAYLFEEKVFVCDMPLIELSNSEKEKIKLLFGASFATDAVNEEKISFQQVFRLDEIDEMPNMIENIFTGVFDLGAAYELEIEIE